MIQFIIVIIKMMDIEISDVIMKNKWERNCENQHECKSKQRLVNEYDFC